MIAKRLPAPAAAAVTSATLAAAGTAVAAPAS